MRDSLDSLEDGIVHGKRTPPESDSSNASNPAGGSAFQRLATNERHRDESPLPAPIPKKPASLPRESLDGDTIFAVGDEDKWSDEEGDGEERQGLVGKKS